MHEPLARHTLTDPEVAHQLDRTLLQDPRAHPAFYIFAIALLDDDAFDSAGLQQQRQKHPRRSRTDNADLRAHTKPRRDKIRVHRSPDTQDTLMQRSLVISTSYHRKQLMGIGERNAQPVPSLPGSFKHYKMLFAAASLSVTNSNRRQGG